MKKIISIVVLIAILGVVTGCSNKNEANDASNVIPYNENLDTTSQGASSYDGICNHKDSDYFTSLDYYNLKSNDNLTILSNYKTYQQTTEYTCGPSAALMVLYHFNEESYDELEIAELMKCHKDLNGNNTEEEGVANERGEYGTSTDRMIEFFDEIGWNVTSSLTEGRLEGGYTFDDPEKFKEWVIENLKNNNPMMVEWIDWAGHWQDIIGYDTMGTATFGDDVIVFADPYDTSDHSQDGYYIYPAERFFYMWFDSGILPEEQCVQQWLIATPQ